MVTKGICYSEMWWAEQFYAEASGSVSISFLLINLKPVSGKIQTHKSKSSKEHCLFRQNATIFWVITFRNYLNNR